MAKFKISEQEDWNFTHGTRFARFAGAKSIFVFILVLIFIVVGIVLHEYLFVALVFCFVFGFTWLMCFALRHIVKKRHFLNRFWCDDMEIEFSDRIYKVSVGLNKLSLAVADIASLTERNGYYYLCHDCGLNVLIPNSVLSTEEISLLDKYKIQVKLRDRESKYFNFLRSRRLTRRY